VLSDICSHVDHVIARAQHAAHDMDDVRLVHAVDDAALRAKRACVVITDTEPDGLALLPPLAARCRAGPGAVLAPTLLREEFGMSKRKLARTRKARSSSKVRSKAARKKSAYPHQPRANSKQARCEKLGLTLESEKTDGERVYRIAAGGT
jgi:hypothetical protein